MSSLLLCVVFANSFGKQWTSVRPQLRIPWEKIPIIYSYLSNKYLCAKNVRLFNVFGIFEYQIRYNVTYLHSLVLKKTPKVHPIKTYSIKVYHPFLSSKSQSAVNISHQSALKTDPCLPHRLSTASSLYFINYDDLSIVLTLLTAVTNDETFEFLSAYIFCIYGVSMILKDPQLFQILYIPNFTHIL